MSNVSDPMDRPYPAGSVAGGQVIGGPRLNLVASEAAAPALQNAPAVEDEIDLKRIVNTLWRGKLWVILAATLGFLFGAWYAITQTTAVYTANATVAFQSREEQLVDFDSAIGGLSGDLATINTEIEVMRSRTLIEKLVRELDLVNDSEFNARLREAPSFSIGMVIGYLRGLLSGGGGGEAAAPAQPNERAILDRVIDRTLGAINVTNQRQSYVLRVTATTQNPQKSARLANALAALYIRDQIDVKQEATEEATTWLSERVSDLKVELENATDAVKEFSAGSDLISPEALIVLNRQLKELRDRRLEAERVLITDSARFSALSAAQNAADVSALEALRDDPALRGLTPGSATFFATIRRESDRLSVSVARSDAQLRALEASVQELETRIERQSSDLVTLQQLEREADATGLIYEYFLNRLKETSVQQGIQQADSRLLSAAVVPRGPSAPSKSRIVIIWCFLGGVAGAAFVVLRELSKNTFRTADELEAATGLKVMGQIPLMPVKRRESVLDYIISKPTSAAVEAIRNLRTSTLLSNFDNPPQVIMSTSSMPSEGKTTQSMAMAHNLSGLGKRVLLIEGDIRRLVFAEYFDFKSRKGILTAMSDEATLAETVITDERTGLDILVAERGSVNPADVFSSQKFAALMEEARAQYDYIVIDTAPVLLVPDARIIAQHADALLYAVKWDATSRRQVADGLKSFASVGLSVTGLVLSQVDPKGLKRYGYGDSYGGYYGKAASHYYNN